MSIHADRAYTMSSHLELTREQTPTTECLMLHSLNKQPSEINASLICRGEKFKLKIFVRPTLYFEVIIVFHTICTLHLSSCVGGKFRGAVKKGVLGS